jgi:hypothetical protein
MQLTQVILSTILISSSCLILGFALLRKLQFHSPWEELSFRYALGLGLHMTGVFVLGLVHGINEASIIAWTLFPFVLSWGYRDSLIRFFKSLWYRLLSHPWALALGVVFAGVWLSMPLYPVVGWDETAIHLSSAKAYLNSGHLPLLPHFRYPMSVMLNHMLFVTGLVFAEDSVAQCLQFVNTTILGIGLLAFGLRYFNYAVSGLALALFIANDSIVLHSTSALVDVGAAFFSTFAVYAFLNWMYDKSNSDNHQWALISGLMAGCSAAVKLNTAFMMGVLLICFVYFAIKKKQTRSLVLFGLSFTLIAGPWYIRNWIMIGNPVFPMFPSVFGYSLWTKEQVDSLFNFLEVQAKHERTLLGFLKIPYNMAFDMMTYGMDARYTKWYFYLLPLAAVAVYKYSVTRWVLFFTLAHAVFWFTGVHNMRHFLPALPLYTLVIASGIFVLKDLAPKLWARITPKVVMAIILLSILRSSHYAQWIITGTPIYSYHPIEGRGPLPLTDADREAHRLKKIQGLDAIRFLNENYGSKYSVFITYSESLAYYVDGTYLGDWFGPGDFFRVLGSKNYGEIPSSEVLYKNLKDLGADFFMYATFNFKGVVPKPPQDDFFKSHFELVKENGYHLYKLH